MFVAAMMLCFLSGRRWNHAFKNQITTLQSQAKNRANPNRSEVQANLSLFLEAASGFYTQVSSSKGFTSEGFWFWSPNSVLFESWLILVWFVLSSKRFLMLVRSATSGAPQV